MKRLSKFLSLSLVALFTLTSCTFLENVIGNILVNAFIKTPYLVTAIDLMPEGKESEPKVIEWEKKPTESENRGKLEYLKNVLIIPSSLSTNLLNTPISVLFDVSFNDQEDAFKVLTITKDELPEGFNFDLSSLPFPVDFALNLVIPVGTSTILDDVNTFSELEETLKNKSKQELIDATNQASSDVDLTITLRSGDTTKSEKFYFSLEKPNFSDVILDEVFKSKYLINIYHEKDDSLEDISVLPTDINNPLPISYFRDSLAIPKKIDIVDVGEVTFEVTTDHPELFFNMNMAKPIEEIDATNTEITGDVEVYTFTPVGTYKNEIPSTVVTIDDLRNHFEGVETKTLYQYATQEKFDFTITIKATNEGQSRTETYYFTLEEPNLDKEIGEAIMKDYDIINIINHSNLNESMANPPQPKDPLNPYDLRYFKETLVFPETFEFSDFKDKIITFNIDLHGNDSYFFKSIKDHTYEGNPVTGQTFSPIGTYDASSVTSFQSLVDHISLNGPAIDAHNASEVSRNVNIIVSILINDTITASQTYYFNLIPY
ncbi:MAG: hypothetical protein RBS24_02675 [Bacilli bacterium]|nr:hypothetical protein [Bacilli bacterium]